MSIRRILESHPEIKSSLKQAIQDKDNMAYLSAIKALTTLWATDLPLQYLNMDECVVSLTPTQNSALESTIYQSNHNLPLTKFIVVCTLFVIRGMVTESILEDFSDEDGFYVGEIPEQETIRYLQSEYLATVTELTLWVA